MPCLRFVSMFLGYGSRACLRNVSLARGTERTGNSPGFRIVVSHYAPGLPTKGVFMRRLIPVKPSFMIQGDLLGGLVLLLC